MTNTNPKKVYNLIILDESGSMQSIKQPVINGFNEIIQSIRNTVTRDTELQQWIHFWSFNGSGIKEQIPVSLVSQLTELNENTYQPNDTTPLYDAIGKACNKLRAATENERDAAFLVTILTDGEENSSVEYDFAAIAGLIKELREKGWVFTYIGANHDVEQTSRSLYINNSISFQASSDGVEDLVAKEKSSRILFYNKVKSGYLMNPDDNYFEKGKQP